MKQNSSNTIIIHKTLLDLMGSGEIFSDQKFEELCSYFSDMDIETIFQSLLSQADTQSIYWLIQYLVKIEQPLGFEKLFVLSENENKIIRQEVRLAFKRLLQIQREGLLLRLLDSKWIDNVIFSTGELGELRSQRAVLPLMEIVVKYKNEQEIILNTVRSLGRIQDRRALSLLEGFINHEDHKIQEAVLKSLWNFNEIFHERLLDQWLAKGGLRVKEFIYLKLLQQMGSKWQLYLAKRLSFEHHEAIKLSLLSSIRSIQVKELFDIILGYALGDVSLHVRVLAESVLKKIRSNQLLHWILKKEKQNNEQQKVLLLRILFAYSHAPGVFGIFLRNFHESKNKRIQLMCLEYMGCCPNEQVIPFLLSIIEENDDFAYVACNSLTDKLKPSQWPVIKQVLSLDVEKRGICIQLLLKFILRIHPIDALPEFIEKQLQRLAVSPSEHIRYLAIKAILRTVNPDKLYLFLLMARFDKSYKVRQAAEENILYDLRLNPHKILSFLSLGLDDNKLLITISRVLKQIDPAPVHFLDVLNVLLELVLKNCDTENGPMGLKAMRRMVLLRHHIIKHKQLFIQVFSNQTWSQQQLRILIKVMNLTDIYLQIGLSVDFMAKQYQQVSSDIKVEFLVFFRNMKIKSKAIEDVLFQELAQTKDEVLFQRVNQTINQWLKTSIEVLG